MEAIAGVECLVCIEYVRAVRWEGNVKPQGLMEKVFEVVDGN
jgi:hydrogenase maturation factor